MPLYRKQSLTPGLRIQSNQAGGRIQQLPGTGGRIQVVPANELRSQAKLALTPWSPISAWFADTQFQFDMDHVDTTIGAFGEQITRMYDQGPNAYEVIPNTANNCTLAQEPTLNNRNVAVFIYGNTGFRFSPVALAGAGTTHTLAVVYYLKNISGLSQCVFGSQTDLFELRVQSIVITRMRMYDGSNKDFAANSSTLTRNSDLFTFDAGAAEARLFRPAGQFGAPLVYNPRVWGGGTSKICGNTGGSATQCLMDNTQVAYIHAINRVLDAGERAQWFAWTLAEYGI